jgi:hypothetical protein
LLHSFLVLAKYERPADSAQATAQDVQQNVDFPGLESATFHLAGNEFLD